VCISVLPPAAPISSSRICSPIIFGENDEIYLIFVVVKMNYTELNTSFIEVVENYEVLYSQNLKGYRSRTEQEKA
jgi:hypothetical protein